jgi:hypothetical protein
MTMMEVPALSLELRPRLERLLVWEQALWWLEASRHVWSWLSPSEQMVSQDLAVVWRVLAPELAECPRSAQERLAGGLVLVHPR